MKGLVFAFRCFFRALAGRPLDSRADSDRLSTAEHNRLEAKCSADDRPEPPNATRIDDASTIALLTLLQEEGRLIDFLQEEVEGYDDAEIGAAARTIHRGCHEALETNFSLSPIVEEAENTTFSVPQGFDPTRIRIVGNIVGDPPFEGIVRHRGWQVLPSGKRGAETRFARLSGVITPAEIELS